MFYERQSATGNAILCHRPAKASSIFPVVLIVEAFGQFVDNVSPNTELVPSSDDYEFAHEWRDIALELHEDEDAIMGAMRNLWEKHGIKLDTSKPLRSSSASTNGDLSSHGSMYLIVNVKVALGSGGADAALEALWYKAYSLLQKQEDGWLCDTYSEPCFIITIVGKVYSVCFSSILIFIRTICGGFRCCLH